MLLLQAGNEQDKWGGLGRQADPSCMKRSQLCWGGAEDKSAEGVTLRRELSRCLWILRATQGESDVRQTSILTWKVPALSQWQEAQDRGGQGAMGRGELQGPWQVQGEGTHRVANSVCQGPFGQPRARLELPQLSLECGIYHQPGPKNPLTLL